MNMRPLTFIFLALVVLSGCQPEYEVERHELLAPGEQVKVNFLLLEGGMPGYSVAYKNNLLIDTSTLGFSFRDIMELRGGLKVESVERSSKSESWEPLWGEQAEVLNEYQQMNVKLKERRSPYREMELVFRAYDDGIAFRYVFPEQQAMNEVVIMDEHTEFKLTGDHQCWWIPGDWDIYEHLYNTTRFSEIDALSKRDHPDLSASYIPFNAVNTPVTMKTDDGIYLSFHEADLEDYSGMTLMVDKDNMKWVSELVGSRDESKVTTQTPFETPWRSVQIAEEAGDLIESKLIVNLNEPNKLENTDWIEPMKYVGIWWEMHLDKSTWDMASGRHGATTQNAKRYIDFAAANNIQGLLVEGWNTGWENWTNPEEREGIFDFVTPYADYDLQEVVRYAQQKGVSMIMHHETSAAPRTYEKQLDTAFALCQELGIHAIKTGYVGAIIPKGEYHHGQYMVRHYQKVLEKAAEYEIMVDAHEPIKATGRRRTYPNMMAREGLRGQEFNAWSSEGGNPPEHLTIVPFTRMLSGPIDYTPGIFNLQLEGYKENNQVKNTLAKELALYIVIYGPLQMAADLPEHYRGQPAFEFIRQVPVDWQTTDVLNGEVGDYVTIARKEKDGERWFLGSITDENARNLEVSLNFLDEGKTYRALMYTDIEATDWKQNPNAIGISERRLTRDSSLNLQLSKSGGAAISFEPVE